MKNRYIFPMMLGLALLTACQQRPEKTIADLQKGAVNEATASARYTAFSAKARSEGYEGIARIFDAASRSERVHFDRFTEFLEKMEEKVPDFQPIYELKSTEENLRTAITLESNEVNIIYPGFKTDVLAEKQNEVAETMVWALNAEKKHLAYLQKALKLLTTDPGSLKTLPYGYQICPICGNTCDSLDVQKNCPSCMTSSDIFIRL